MKEKIIGIITKAILELNEELEKPELNNPTEGTFIYGREGALKSLDLVSLIADLESKIADEFGCSIPLADEHAMSQEHSPFKTVKSLAEYIEPLLQKYKN